MDGLRFCRHPACNAGEYRPWKQHVRRGRWGRYDLKPFTLMLAGAALRPGFFCYRRGCRTEAGSSNSPAHIPAFAARARSSSAI